MPAESSVVSITGQICDLGVRPGGVVLVHSSFSALRPVDGGPAGVIEALLAAVGQSGTVVMPSWADDDEAPFDPGSSSCGGLGIVADTFWRLPGVLRSDSPHSFAAVGPAAEAITAAHPIDVPHGLDSPVGRVYQMDGQVLLLGVGHDANTTIHLAENLAGVRYRRPKYVMVSEGGRLRRHEYSEIDHCCERFGLVDGWLRAAGMQREGLVGHAPAMLMDAREVVAAVAERLARNETEFLHEVGVDSECDEARKSIPL